MSISVTWATYALIVSMCLFIYYTVIAITYRKTFQHRFVKRTNHQPFDSFEASSSEDRSRQQSNIDLLGEEVPDEELKIAAEADDSAANAQEFASEIEAYTSSCGDTIRKEELIRSLQKIIQKYPSLIHSESKYELSRLITMHSENHCSIHLAADEVAELWNG